MRKFCLAICLVLLSGTLSFAGTVDDLNTAISALKSNQPDRAKTTLAKVIQDANTSTEHKGMAYYLLSFTEKNPDEALVYCNKAAELAPGDARAFERLGLLYHQKKNYAKAVEMLDKAIDITPVNAAAYSLRGISHRDMGNLDKALTDLDKSISLDPSEGVFYVRRGIARHIANQPDAALEDFTAAVEHRVPQGMQGICYFYAGKIYQGKSNLQKAKSMLQTAAHYLTDEEMKIEAAKLLEQLKSTEKWS